MSLPNVSEQSKFLNTQLGIDCTWVAKDIDEEQTEKDRVMGCGYLPAPKAKEIMTLAKARFGFQEDDGISFKPGTGVNEGKLQVLIEIDRVKQKEKEKIQADKKTTSVYRASKPSGKSDESYAVPPSEPAPEEAPPSYENIEHEQQLVDERARARREGDEKAVVAVNPSASKEIESDPREREAPLRKGDEEYVKELENILNNNALFTGSPESVGGNLLNRFAENEELSEDQFIDLDLAHAKLKKITRDSAQKYHNNFMIHIYSTRRAGRGRKAPEGAISLDPKRIDKFKAQIADKQLKAKEKPSGKSESDRKAEISFASTEKNKVIQSPSDRERDEKELIAKVPKGLPEEVMLARKIPIQLQNKQNAIEIQDDFLPFLKKANTDMLRKLAIKAGDNNCTDLSNNVMGDVKSTISEDGSDPDGMRYIITFITKKVGSNVPELSYVALTKKAIYEYMEENRSGK